MPETSTVTASPSPTRSALRPGALLLVLGMALGSVVMWLAIPAGWVLLAAQVSQTSRPTMLPLVMVLVGAPLTMLPMMRVLHAMDQRHQRLLGVQDDRRRPAPWRESMRDAEQKGPQSVLAVVMVLSVAIAFAAFGVWFFLFAGSSLPS